MQTHGVFDIVSADFQLHLVTAFLVVEYISSGAFKETNKETKIKKQIKVICELVRENPYITYNEFMEKLDIGYSSVYERVKILKQQGILIRNGGLYGGSWKINEELYSQFYLSS